MTKPCLDWLCCLLIGLCLGGSVLAASSDAPVRIGVLAYRGEEQARQAWQGHADYLARQLPGHRFVIVPLGYDALGEAVRRHDIELLLTNTGHYTELEATGEVSRIATRLIAGPNGPLDRFGGLAVTLAGRSDLQHYRDLKGQRLLIPDKSSLGGWQVHLREALAQKTELEHAARQIIETGNHEKVIERLLAGEADAGFVRSDLVEAMTAAGKIPPGSLKPIDPQQTPGYPYLHSTRLYPEWPLARVGNFPEQLTKEILIALLAMRPDDPAARSARIAGWTLPHNYQPVLELFREARIGPYAHQEIVWDEIMRRHGADLLMIAGSLVGLLLFGLLRIARSNRQLRESEEGLRLAAGVFKHAEEGILITNGQGCIVDANESASRLTGYPHTELIGQTPRLLSSGRHPREFYGELWKTLLDKGIWRGELWNCRRDGTPYIQQTSISSIRNPDGKTTHYVGIFSDITALKENQQQLEHLAYYDALTGLPNRLLLADRMRQAIALAERRRHRFAVCYLDLDNFKPINDRWGHKAGDLLLIEVAHRLSAALRQEDTVCRLGGDEFVLLINELNSLDECEQALKRIEATLAAPFAIDREQADISASIGITLYPDDGCDPDTLLRDADHAMYVAKHDGRHRHRFFRRRDKLDNADYPHLAQALRQALARHELRLDYQPKAELQSGRIVGAEALLRWPHPERGLLMPDVVLPLVEQAGLHAELGEYVLDTALSQMEHWAAAGLVLQISVNIDAQHLQAPDFVARLQAILHNHPTIPPQQLELEIVETAALKDLTQVSERIAACRKLGVQFAIDDFGTGYSSLSYLKQLPVQTLKIDRSFVHNMLEDPDDLAIVDGVIGLAVAFRHRVIAEGIESVEHGSMLLHLGCEYGQGYGIARPMPAERLSEWIAGWQVPPAWQKACRWPAADLPLLTVKVDHLRWMRQFEAALDAEPGSQPALPPLDSAACRFGEWIEREGRARYGHLPAFQEIVSRHDDVHRCAHALLEQYATDPLAARASREALHECRDTLLDGLHRLYEQLAATRSGPGLSG